MAVSESNFINKLKPEIRKIPERLMFYVDAMDEIYKEIYKNNPKTYDDIKKIEAGNLYAEDKDSFCFSVYSVNCEVSKKQNGWSIKVISFDDYSRTHTTAYFGKELEKTANIFNDVCNSISQNKKTGTNYQKPKRDALAESKSVSGNKPAKQVDVRKER